MEMLSFLILLFNCVLNIILNIALTGMLAFVIASSKTLCSYRNIVNYNMMPKHLNFKVNNFMT